MQILHFSFFTFTSLLLAPAIATPVTGTLEPRQLFRNGQPVIDRNRPGPSIETLTKALGPQETWKQPRCAHLSLSVFSIPNGATVQPDETVEDYCLQPRVALYCTGTPEVIKVLGVDGLQTCKVLCTCEELSDSEVRPPGN